MTTESRRSNKGKPPMSRNLKGSLLFAAAAGLVADVGSRDYNKAEMTPISEVSRSVHPSAEEVEKRNIDNQRKQMLEEASRAQEQHLPWAGRFLLRSCLLDKKAEGEPAYDDNQIQDRYDELLAQLRVKLQGVDLDFESVHRALGELLQNYPVERSPHIGIDDLLANRRGDWSSIGLLVAALLQDLSVPNIGLRITVTDPKQIRPRTLNQIEATIRITKADGVHEYGLQSGNEVGTNGVYVLAADLLRFYNPGSLDLIFPAPLLFPVPQTDEERRPNLPRDVAAVPFQSVIMNDSVVRRREDDRSILSDGVDIVGLNNPSDHVIRVRRPKLRDQL